MLKVNTQVLLRARPQGMPTEADFEKTVVPIPEPREGEALVQTLYVSVDPYMRGHISGRKSYMAPAELGAVMPGGAVGKVLKSRARQIAEGAIVRGGWGWQEYAVVSAHLVELVDSSLGPIPTALGVLGMPGMTAYFGLFDVGQPRPGDEVFVTGAAGAVGSLVGQLAKIAGCRVAGSAGSDDKVEALLRRYGFDAAFNYKDAKDPSKAVQAACPNGIDIFFDNTGGPLSDAAFAHLNLGARISICGQIEQYNATDAPMGPRNLFHLIVKRARAEGFLVTDYSARYAEARIRIAKWIKDGRILYDETIIDGVENAPKAFIGLFSGENLGKQLVRAAAE